MDYPLAKDPTVIRRNKDPTVINRKSPPGTAASQSVIRPGMSSEALRNARGGPGAGLIGTQMPNQFAVMDDAMDEHHAEVPLASRAGCKNFWEQMAFLCAPQRPFFSRVSVSRYAQFNSGRRLYERGVE